MLGLEVRNDATASALGSDGEDALVLCGSRQVAPKQVLDEAMNRGQSAIACRCRVAAGRLEMVEEG
jgi:hypothetical protein